MKKLAHKTKCSTANNDEVHWLVVAQYSLTQC